MRFLVTALAVLTTACSSTKPAEELEAPDVQFQRALVLAVMPPEQRQEVEDAVVEEIQRRRPNVKITPTYTAFPDLTAVSAERLRGYVQRSQVDLVITIMPFAEIVAAEYDDFEDIAEEELGEFMEGTSVTAAAGRFGVQVVGWKTPGARPVYAKTSEIMVGSVVGTQGVADFAVVSVTRDL